MKIICIGRNYIDHVKELNNTVTDDPIFFLKPETAIQPRGHPFFIPDFTNNVHYEVELVLKINKAGKYIEERFANRYYSEIGLGIDFTARDIQEHCKSNGLPWEKAKGFDGSAQISNTFINKYEIDINNITFSLLKNNKQVQLGNSSQMIFNFDKIISYVSKYCSLKIGDLIYTGTPSGVSNIEKGDILKGFICEKEMLNVIIK